ncbi:MAG: hypothetical protein HYX67_07930 [Candidatus Melainabacteria bacterium]|nr:hypothetical protein [Candidatus Melainabacteria bacterium]
MQKAQQRQQQDQQRQQQVQQRVQQNAEQLQQRSAQEQMQRAQQRQQQAQQQAQQRDQQAQQQSQERAQRAQQRQQMPQQHGQLDQPGAQDPMLKLQQSQQQAQQKRDQELQQRAQQAQQRDQQRQQQDQQRQQRDQKFQQRNAQEQLQKVPFNQNDAHQHQPPGQGVDRIQNPIRTPNFDKKNRRPSTLPPLRVQPIPPQKAFPMPHFGSHASADQLEQARIAQINMMKHLRAIPLSQAPQNRGRFRTLQMQNYYNNYPFYLNNQRYYINRNNTNYFRVQPNYYPSWYQPNSNWIFSNGFSLANAVRIGADWLGYGWHPSYGAPPVGFICARDYIPTPWFYNAMTGQWRQPGLYSSMSEGPDYEYTGPITVEVIEQVVAPDGQIVNVPYLYNAFYYPDQGRWAYENRQGYFIWLEI